MTPFDDVDLIVSQGRLGDRSYRTIEGAGRIAAEFQRRYGWMPLTCGSPEQPAYDNWIEALAASDPTLLKLSEQLSRSLDSGRFPVIIANTCSASLATLPVVVERKPLATVLWIDAHADFNTPETTTSGYLGGMVLAAACGLWDSGHGAGLSPERIILVGTRDVDEKEGELLENLGVRVVSPGRAATTGFLEMLSDDEVWIHIDWDVIEPGSIAADYNCPGGIELDRLHAILNGLQPDSVLGIEIAEYSPVGKVGSDADVLAMIAGVLSPLLGGLPGAEACGMKRTKSGDQRPGWVKATTPRTP